MSKRKIGSVVTTSKDVRWVLVKMTAKGEFWKDTVSGLTWHPREKDRYTYNQAMGKFGDKLPTIEEFIDAEKHGIREVLPNMGYWFWSASPYPYSKYFARGFYGGVGGAGGGYRDDGGSVRCVGR